MPVSAARQYDLDARRLRREAKGRDVQRDRAYKAGLAGNDLPFEGQDDELLDLYNSGQADRDQPTLRAVPTPSGASDPTTGAQAGSSLQLSGGDHVAGVILGVLGAALAVQYLRGGWSGVATWLGAKFLNKAPSQGGTAAPAEASPTPVAGTAPSKGAAGGQAPPGAK
jgi:hypothetical protein